MIGRGLSGLVLAAAVLGLVGCAGSPPSSFYSLSSLAESGAGSGVAVRGHSGLALGLGPVVLPEFLDRPQIVTRSTSHRLKVDEFHRWGGSLRDDFTRVLGENLGRLLGTSRILVLPSEIRYPLDFRIAAEVLAFEGSASGDALLDVRWSILNPRLDQALVVRQDTYRRAVAAPGDEGALIAAMSSALADFSRDVAAEVAALPPAAGSSQSQSEGGPTAP